MCVADFLGDTIDWNDAVISFLNLRHDAHQCYLYGTKHCPHACITERRLTLALFTLRHWSILARDTLYVRTVPLAWGAGVGISL